MERLGKRAKDRFIKTVTSPTAKKVARETLKDVIKNGIAKKLFMRKWSKKLLVAFDGDEVAIAEFLEENLSYSKEDAKRYAMLIVIEDNF